MARCHRSLAAIISVGVVIAAAAGFPGFVWAQSASPRTGASDQADVNKTPPSVLPLPDTGTASDWRASQLIGANMTNILDESVGKVQDVVIDADGKVVAVLVAVGGFLGLGETSVAIGMRHLIITHTDVDKLEVKTSLSRKAIEQAASLGSEEMNRTVAPK